MEPIESIEYELFAINKKKYLPAIKEMRCKTCSFVALPPYRINSDCFCFSCMKSLKPIVRKQAKTATIFELFTTILGYSIFILDTSFFELLYIYLAYITLFSYKINKYIF